MFLEGLVLKNQLSRLWSLQSSRFSFGGGINIEAIIASEKEVWNREKLSLQKSLKRAEAEVYKLKADLRNEALLQNLSPDAGHAAIKVGGLFHGNVCQRKRALCFCLLPSLTNLKSKINKKHNSAGRIQIPLTKKRQQSKVKVNYRYFELC